MLLRWSTLLLTALLAVAVAPAAAGPNPPTLYTNANIHTLDPARPRARAIAVAPDGRILAVGSDAEARAAAGPNPTVHDLNNHTVLPGLIDAHGHLAGLGMLQLGHIDLREARSYEDLIAHVAAHAATRPKGEWILGGRWDHESWPDKQLPIHHALSTAVPDHPVWLTRVDGHAALANAAAMKLAKITPDTPSPAGGEILKDQRGDPTGVFIDNAESLIDRVVRGPDLDPAAIIGAAQRLCLAAGLTGVHDMGLGPSEVAAFRTLAAEGTLKLRIYGVLAGPYAGRYIMEHEPYISDRFTLRSIKLYADGAMGSRGAWLLAPYEDRSTDPEGNPYTGLAVTDPADIQAITEVALSRGWQVCTHAIGDRANREILDAYERALTKVPTDNHRLRIEHAQLLDPSDIPRFAKLSIIPSMQPTHCTSDMRWVDARVGPQRAKGAYAWASLLQSGARIAAGSDFPVESHNPFLGFYAAITRQDASGHPAGGWQPEQRMTREEALRAMTIDAAHAAFEETSKGSLEPGKWADFIVIDRDVMTCDPADIPRTKVLMTAIGGEVVYRSGNVRE